MSPDSRVWILADDLTGAADSALPFWRAGREARIVVDPLAPWPENPGVLSLCTHTRAQAEAAAQAVLSGLVPRLPSSGILFKKVDSTLRGWIGAECAPLLAALPGRRAFFSPVYPSKGRTMGADGVYRVHGTPLATTEFAAEISGLSPDSTLPAFLARHFGADTPRVDCVPADSADALRDAVTKVTEPVLWIGSPGLAIALAGPASLPPPAPPPPTELPPAPIVVALGSRRSLTHRQAAALEQALAAAASADTDVSLLRIPDATYDPARSDALAQELGARAAAKARSLGRCGLILSGGDIAAATFRHLGIRSAEIVAEVEDGLPVLRAEQFLIVTKAGGFGDEGSLVRAYARLAALLT